jgi:protein-disulfide isomerase
MFRNFKTVLDIVSTVLVSAAAGVLLVRTFSPAPSSRAQVEEVKDVTLAADIVRHVRGKGPIALVAFSDYQCPFCAKHVQENGPSIKSKLLDTGAIREVYLNFPLRMHAFAEKAGEAAECAAEQGRFWEMHEAIFADAKALGIDNLTRHAEQLGLDIARFTKCIDSGQTAAAVQRDLDEGTRLAVNATPAFFIGVVEADGGITLRKRINGVAPFEEFEKAIKDLQPTRRARTDTGQLLLSMFSR